MLLILIPTAIEAASLLDDPCDLQFGQPITTKINGRSFQTALCGFGLAAAGVGASCAIKNAPEAVDKVILVGSAGSYDLDQHPVTSTIIGDRVRCVDIGVPDNAGVRLTVDLPGISPWPDELPLKIPDPLSSRPAGLLLSVAGPAVSREHAADRQRDFEQAAAEEMEGYAVAITCRTHGVPLTIIRGVSNLAGDRDKSRWRMREAMHAVKEALLCAVDG